MKRVNIVGENPHIFWTTWGILMTFSGKMWLMVIIKLKKGKNINKKTGPHPISKKIHF